MTMTPKRISFVFTLALLLMTACGSPAATAQPVPSLPAGTPSAIPTGTATAPAPTGNDAPIPFPADTAVLTWHREGGIAGFCDDLTVYADGSFTVANCTALPESERDGHL